MTRNNTDNDRQKPFRKPDDPSAALRDIGLSADLLKALDKALPSMRLARYGAGETVYRERSEVEALYLVLDGRIKLMNYSTDGSARIVRLHKPGSILGLNGLLDEIHDHTAVAIDEVALYVLPMRAIRGIADEDRDAYLGLLEYSHEYLKEADTWITEFSAGSIRGRVARLVLYLMSIDESSGAREVDLLTVNEMAEIIGVTPESVSRVLAEFKRKKLLSPVSEEFPDLYACDIDALRGEAES